MDDSQVWINVQFLWRWWSMTQMFYQSFKWFQYSVSWVSDGKFLQQNTLAQLNWIHFLKKQLLDADMLTKTEPFHWLQMSLPTPKLLSVIYIFNFSYLKLAGSCKYKN